MIQRIQTIYLFLASLCSFGLFTADLAETPAPVIGSQVFNDAQLTVFDSPLLIGGAVGAGLLALMAIFLFGNRRLQKVLCNVAILITLAYAAYGALLWINDLAAEQAGPDFGVALPVLTVVFALLAAHFISKDEKLVRSADRLR